VPASQVPADGVIAYNAQYLDREIRVAALLVPCGGGTCMVQVAETTNKRRRLARNIVLSSLVPELLITLATLAIVWFGVKRGLAPLKDLSDEIRSRSARDLRPIDPGHAPDEARPLVAALNQLFGQVAQSNRNQQRFLANAAHQLRTPLAGLQAHTEIALALDVPDAHRAQLEQVHARPSAPRASPTSCSRWRARSPAATGPMPHACQPARGGRRRGRRVGAPRDGKGDRPRLRTLGCAGRRRGAAAARGACESRPQRARVQRARRAGDRAYRGPERLRIPRGRRRWPRHTAAEREQVLERFYRAPGTSGTGSGLGLAIVREIALAHGAEIVISTGEGGRAAKLG